MSVGAIAEGTNYRAFRYKLSGGKGCINEAFGEKYWQKMERRSPEFFALTRQRIYRLEAPDLRPGRLSRSTAPTMGCFHY